jgi:hypothetical protein
MKCRCDTRDRQGSELAKNLASSCWTKPVSDVTLVHVWGMGSAKLSGGGKCWRLGTSGGGMHITEGNRESRGLKEDFLA